MPLRVGGGLHAKKGTLLQSAKRTYTTASGAVQPLRRLFRPSLLRFFPIALILCGAVIAAVAIYRHEQELQQSAVLRALALQRTIVEQTLRATEADLTMLADDADVHGLLTDGHSTYRKAVIDRLLALLDAKLKYRRARILDRNGQELVRIDSGGRDGTPVVSIVSPSAAAGIPDHQEHAAALVGELLVSPIRHQARPPADGGAAPDVLPMSANLADLQGRYLGRVTLEVRLAPILIGLRRTGADPGVPLLLDDDGQLLLGDGVAAGVADGPALVSAMKGGGDGEVQTAEGRYAFTTLVYKTQRPLRGDEGFLEPPGTPAGSGSGVLKAVFFRADDPVGNAAPAFGIAAGSAGLLGIAGLLFTRRSGIGIGRKRMPAGRADGQRPPNAVVAGDEVERRGHAFLERILNTVPQPIFVKDRQGRFLFLNDALCEMTGYRREDMLGRTDHDFFPKEQADGFIAVDEEVFRGNQRKLREEALTNACGDVHVLSTRKAACTDANGNLVLVGVVTDITEQKRTEEMLRLSAEVFEHSAEGILITDDAGNILSVNRAFSRISGYSAREAIGNHARMLASGQQNAEFFADIFRTIEDHGFWIGEMVSRRKNGEVFVVEISVCAVRDDSGAVRRYIAMMSDITLRKSNEERMRYLAQHDFLTGLANRHLLQDRVSQAVLHARRSRRQVGILLLDLDAFKQVNDRFGHEAGDQVLKEVGVRLTRLVRQTDTVARIGGDEFVAVLPGIRSLCDAQRIAHKVANEVARPFAVAGGVARVGASIGIALFPDDGEEWATLSRVADRAMYEQKRGRRRDVAPLRA